MEQDGVGQRIGGGLAGDWLARLRRFARTAEGRRMAALLTVAAVVRLAFAPFPGFFDDPQYYVDWGRLLPGHPWDFYSTGAHEALLPPNYPPLTIYLFALLDGVYVTVAPLVHTAPALVVAHAPLLAILTKVPTIAADLGITGILYALARRRLSPRGALGVAGAFAFSPTILFAGVLWGQTDSLFTLTMLGALLCAVRRQSATAGALNAVAIMLKPQPLIFVPLLVFYLTRHAGWRAGLRALVGVCAGIGVIALPYIVPPWSEAQAFYTNFASITAKWPGATVTAFNLWWLVGAAGHPYNTAWLGPLSPNVIGLALFLGSYIVACVGVWRDASQGRLMLAAALLTLSFFDVTTLQHERYLYPALVLFLVWAVSDRRGWLLYALSSVTLLLNMALVVVLFAEMSRPGVDVHGMRAWALEHPEVTVAVAATNVALLVACIVISVRGPRAESAMPVREGATGGADADLVAAPR